jgi:hypothetical protein
MWDWLPVLPQKDYEEWLCRRTVNTSKPHCFFLFKKKMIKKQTKRWVWCKGGCASADYYKKLNWGWFVVSHHHLNWRMIRRNIVAHFLNTLLLVLLFLDKLTLILTSQKESNISLISSHLFHTHYSFQAKLWA